MKIFLLTAFCMMFGSSESSRLQNFSPGNQILSANIYQELLKIQKGNFMVSPLSLEIVMALVGAGAKGTTGVEIRSALQLPSNQTEVNSIFSELIPILRGTDKYNLTTANRIFVRDGFAIRTGYKNLASRSYHAGVENVNFNNSNQSAKLINDWVERQTNDKIKDIVTPNTITPDLVMILINTIYFNANWSTQFVPVREPQLFHAADGQIVYVDTMSITGEYNYFDSQKLDCQILEIPYIGDDVSMIIALPKKTNGLASLEHRIAELFAHNNFSRQRVYVELPKFSTETTIEFKPILENLGVKRAFTDAANFNGIAPYIKINFVVQKTFINVTESGTEAAAATAVGVVVVSVEWPGEPRLRFIANHPFIYYIKNKENVILFVGRYATNAN